LDHHSCRELSGCTPGRTPHRRRERFSRCGSTPTGAGLQALGQASEVTIEIDFEAHAADTSPLVREEVLKTTRVRNPDQLGPLLRALVIDPSSRVRATVLALAREADDVEVIDQIADADEDAFLRGLAAVGREELAHSDPDTTECQDE
jgi:hypothetical protein